MSEREKRLLLGVLLGYVFLQNACEIAGIAMPIANFPFSDSIVFCLLGYLIDHVGLTEKKERILFLLAAPALVVSSCFLLFYPGKNPSVYGLCVSRILLCAVLFVLVTRHTEKSSRKWEAQILLIASQTYFIYLFHGLMQDFVRKVIFGRGLKLWWGLEALAGALLVFVISLLSALFANWLKNLWRKH